MPGGEIGELALEVGQALGQAVALLAQRLSCRLDVRCKALVAIRSMPRRLVHASSDSSKSGAGLPVLIRCGLPRRRPWTVTSTARASVKLALRKSGQNPRARIERVMPIYEYECDGCRRRVSLLVLRPSAAEAPTCPRCGSSALSRVMSRFATVKSEDARLDALTDSASLGDLDENNPASVARFMKKMGRELGDDLGDDFESAMDEAMAEGEGAGDGDAESPGAADASPDESL